LINSVIAAESLIAGARMMIPFVGCDFISTFQLSTEI
jgi:hypothetical protein